MNPKEYGELSCECGEGKFLEGGQADLGEGVVCPEAQKSEGACLKSEQRGMPLGTQNRDGKRRK